MAFRDDPSQPGLSNVDNNTEVERGAGIPWPSDPQGSYVYYECNIIAVLDSGIVVHNRLPQIDREADTLSAMSIDDPRFTIVTDQGVNLTSRDQYKDIMQRMGHSRYWFNLVGEGLRVGYQIPIPAVKKICGVDAIPYDKNTQWAFNRIFPGGNYGVILWHAQWSLWYTTLEPPVRYSVPIVDPFAHIKGTDIPPKTIQAPFSESDDNATVTDFSGLSGKPRQGTV